MARFFAGVAYPFEGLRFINEHRLWRTCLWIALINFAVFGVIVAVALLLVKPLLAALGVYLSSTFAVQSAFAAHVVSVVSFIAWFVVVLAVIGLSGIAVVLVGQALASPLLDMLSEKVESLVLGTAEAPLSAGRVTRAFVVGIGDLFWGTVTSVVVYTILFLIGLVPGVGTIPATIASSTFAALLASHEFVGLPLTRRFVNYRGRWQAVRENLAVTLGFGTTTLVLLVIPAAGFFVLPLASVGGTLLFCDLIASERL